MVCPAERRGHSLRMFLGRHGWRPFCRFRTQSLPAAGSHDRRDSGYSKPALHQRAICLPIPSIHKRDKLGLILHRQDLQVNAEAHLPFENLAVIQKGLQALLAR